MSRRALNLQKYPDAVKRIVDGLAKGRARAIAQAKEIAAKHQLAVIIAFNADRDLGRPARGRAGRIARRLGGMLSERHVKRILDKLSVCPVQTPIIPSMKPPVFKLYGRHEKHEK